MSDNVLFYVNGIPYRRSKGSVFQPLTAFLREELRLTGTKVVCAEGACGACTVLVGQPRGTAMEYQTLNACLLPLYQIAGCHVITVEGVSKSTTASAVQAALVAGHGAQCGFCTPGMVMTLTDYCEHSSPSEELADALCGNLCRCTGYLPILESARQINLQDYHSLASLYPEREMVLALTDHRQHSVQIEADSRKLFLPANLEEAALWAKSHPEAVIVGGGTELGVQWGRQGSEPQEILSLAFVMAQAQIDCLPDTLLIDAAANWTQIEAAARTCFPALAQLLRRFGGPQIKNAGTLGGQIVQNSPIGDILPLLSVLEARVEVASAEGSKELPMSAFLEADGTPLSASEIVRRVRLPLPRAGQTLRLEKVSRRQGFDRSVVSAALLLTMQGTLIAQAKLAFGGIASHVCRAPQTENFLLGKILDEQTLSDAGEILRAEISPNDNARGSGEYRSLLAANLLLRLLDTERNN